MTPDGIPKIILKYQPKGKRYLGRPLKRWKDCYVMPVTGHKAYTGKEEEEEDLNIYKRNKTSLFTTLQFQSITVLHNINLTCYKCFQFVGCI
jgi:hypothetical protein